MSVTFTNNSLSPSARVDFTDLAVISTNLRKNREAIYPLFNDPKYRHLTVIAAQEPGRTLLPEKTIISSSTHSHWQQVLPTTHGRETRSVLWISRQVKHLPVPIQSADLVATVLLLEHRQVFVASVYIQPFVSRIEWEQRLPDTIEKLSGAIYAARNKHQDLEVLLLGDFNCHDALWGGLKGLDQQRFEGESQPLLDFMEDQQLQSLVPRGTITFEGARGESTIDLILATPYLAQNSLYTDILDYDLASDHRPLLGRFAIPATLQQQSERYLIKQAPWDLINSSIARDLAALPRQDNIDDWETAITSAVRKAVKKYCPKARPSPYARRWWNADLTALRKDYVRKRNAARSQRRAGLPNAVLYWEAIRASKEFHRAARYQRRTHWIEFLENNDNIWKAAKYMDPNAADSFSTVPLLKREDQEITQNSDIADLLLKAFFPPAPDADLEEKPIMYHERPYRDITMDEVETAIHAMSPYKAPGPDGIPAASLAESLAVRQRADYWPL